MEKTVLFAADDSHTYKVVATRTSGRKAEYNYITEVAMVGDLYVLTGRMQPNDGGTMQRRSFTLHSKAHPELDVRQIATTPASAKPQTQTQTEPVGDDEIPF